MHVVADVAPSKTVTLVIQAPRKLRACRVTRPHASAGSRLFFHSSPSHCPAALHRPGERQSHPEGPKEEQAIGKVTLPARQNCCTECPLCCISPLLVCSADVLQLSAEWRRCAPCPAASECRCCPPSVHSFQHFPSFEHILFPLTLLQAAVH